MEGKRINDVVASLSCNSFVITFSVDDCNAIAKRKRTNNELQNKTQKTKDRATRTPQKWGRTQVLPEGQGKQFLFHQWKKYYRLNLLTKITQYKILNIVANVIM